MEHIEGKQGHSSPSPSSCWFIFSLLTCFRPPYRSRFYVYVLLSAHGGAVHSQSQALKDFTSARTRSCKPTSEVQMLRN